MVLLMKKSDFINTLRASTIWVEDRFNNFKLTTPKGKVLRLKIQETSVRLEIQELIGDQKEWIKISSDYFKNVTLTEDGTTRWMKIDRRIFQV
jgi:hypothetical protein